jgi:hypothetical protein
MKLKIINRSSEGREVMDVGAVDPVLGDGTWRYRLCEENVSENRPTAQSGFVSSGFLIS